MPSPPLCLHSSSHDLIVKNTIRDGGSTALKIAYTVDAVDTVDTVDTVYTVYTVDIVDTSTASTRRSC